MTTVVTFLSKYFSKAKEKRNKEKIEIKTEGIRVNKENTVIYFLLDFKPPLSISVLIGGMLGFVSGVVGIGGGIFLSPILFLIKAAKPKHIVTAASLFILINSISGVIGQLTKNVVLSDISNYWYLFLIVIIGGHIGNFISLKIFPTRLLALVTSGLVLFVAIRMGIKLFL